MRRDMVVIGGIYNVWNMFVFVLGVSNILFQTGGHWP